MSVAQETTTIEIDLPVTLVAGDFEQLRLEAYKASLHDPEERSHLLGDLAASTSLAKDSETSLLDEVYDQVTSPVIDRRVSSKPRYHFLLTSNGEVLDIQRIETPPTDRRREARTRAMADDIGWGPKQNRSSFRTHSVERRIHHRRKVA